MDDMKDVLTAAGFVRKQSADIDEEEQRLLNFVIEEIVNAQSENAGEPRVLPDVWYEGCVENSITIKNVEGETCGMRIEVDPQGRILDEVVCIVPVSTYARVFGPYEANYTSKYISSYYDRVIINIRSHRAKAKLLKALSEKRVELVCAVHSISATEMLKKEQEDADKENQEATRNASESYTKRLGQLKGWIKKLQFFVSDDGLPMIKFYFPREVIFYAKDYLSDLGMKTEDVVRADKGEYFLQIIQPVEKDPLWNVLYELRDAANSMGGTKFMNGYGRRV